MIILNHILLNLINSSLKIDNYDTRLINPSNVFNQGQSSISLTPWGGGGTHLFLYGMLPRPLRKNKKGNIMKEKNENNALRAPSEFEITLFTTYIDDNDWDDDVIIDSDGNEEITEYELFFTGSLN